MNPGLLEWSENIKNHPAAKVLLENRNEIKQCPLCNSSVEDREIAIYAELAAQTYAIYRWCGENARHEFSMKDIRHLLDFNGYTRFNDLIRCSNGILYRPQGEGGKVMRRAHYGMHMGRAKEFFHGTRPIHLQIRINQITREKVVLKDVLVNQIPPLKSLLDDKGLYDHEKLL